MTLAIACITRDGAVMIADKRESRNGEYSDNVVKLYPIADRQNKLIGVMTAAGVDITILALRDKLYEKIYSLTKILEEFGELDIAPHLAGLIEKSLKEIKNFNISSSEFFYLKLLFLLAYKKGDREYKHIIYCSSWPRGSNGSQELENSEINVRCQIRTKYMIIGAGSTIADHLFKLLQNISGDICETVGSAIASLGFILQITHMTNTTISQDFDVMIFKDGTYFRVTSCLEEYKLLLEGYNQIFNNVNQLLKELGEHLNNLLQRA